MKYAKHLVSVFSAILLLVGAATAVAAPDEVAGLSLWLDATDAETMMLDGDLVTTWTGKGPVGHVAWADAGAPRLLSNQIMGQSLVSFNGSSSFRIANEASIKFSDQATFFAVVNLDGSVNDTILSKYIGGGYAYIWQMNGNAQANRIGFYTPTAGWQYTPDDVHGPGLQIVELHFDMALAGTMTHFVNGGFVGVNNLPENWTDNDTDMSIGRQGTDGNYFRGAIAEIVLYKSALTDEQRESVGNWLAEKYNITAYDYTHTTRLPETPILTEPADGATGLDPVVVTVKWEAGSDTDSISIYLAKGSGLPGAGDLFRAGINPSDGQIVLVNLDPSTTYTVQAVAVNGDGEMPGPHHVFATGEGEADTVPYTDNLILYLDATAGATVQTDESNAVTRWVDRSGLGHDMSPRGGALTLEDDVVFGKPGIHFPDEGFFETPDPGTDSVFDLTDQATFFVVAQNSPTGSDTLIDKESGGYNYLWSIGGTQIDGSLDFYCNEFGAWQISGENVVGNAFRILELHWDGTTLVGENFKMYVDSEEVVSSALDTVWGTHDNSGLRIGGQSAGGANPYSGYMSEVLMYREALGPVTRNQVGQYLAEKYNISAYGFERTPVPPEPAALVYPEDGATGLDPAALALRWAPGKETDTFQVFIAEGVTSPTAGDLVATLDAQYAFHAARGLAPDTQYTWRVDAVNPDGSVASVTRTFTTGSDAGSLTVFDNLSLWLDADDPGVFDISPAAVQTWFDKSGNHVDAKRYRGSATRIEDQVFGRAAVELNGGDDSFVTSGDLEDNGPIDFSEAADFFIVLRLNDTNAQQTLMTKMVGLTGDMAYHWYLNAGDPGPGSINVSAGVDDGPPLGGASLPGAVPGGQFAVVETWWDAGMLPDPNLRFFVNGNAAGDALVLSPWRKINSPLFIGRNGFGGNLLLADVAEILLYKDALSEENRTAVGQYLARRYNLAAYGHQPVPLIGELTAEGGVEGRVLLRFRYVRNDPETFTLALDEDFTQGVVTGDFAIDVVYEIPGLAAGEEATVYARLSNAGGDGPVTSLTFTHFLSGTSAEVWMLYE